ncbi:MAG: hypothetical protein AB7G87_13050 [Clostridia bacterium]
MANLTMVFIFDEILTALCELGLAEGSIRQYIRYFRKMQRFFLGKGASEYSERILDEYWISVSEWLGHSDMEVTLVYAHMRT